MQMTKMRRDHDENRRDLTINPDWKPTAPKDGPMQSQEMEGTATGTYHHWIMGLNQFEFDLIS